MKSSKWRFIEVKGIIAIPLDAAMTVWWLSREIGSAVLTHIPSRLHQLRSEAKLLAEGIWRVEL